MCVLQYLSLSLSLGSALCKSLRDRGLLNIIFLCCSNYESERCFIMSWDMNTRSQWWDAAGLICVDIRWMDDTAHVCRRCNPNATGGHRGNTRARSREITSVCYWIHTNRLKISVVRIAQFTRKSDIYCTTATDMDCVSLNENSVINYSNTTEGTSSLVRCKEAEWCQTGDVRSRLGHMIPLWIRLSDVSRGLNGSPSL